MKEEIGLVIGDKAWSSWSLRPWLAARVAKIPFIEIPVNLRREDTPEQIARYSPSGRVPVLLQGNNKMWDSLAICEYLAELAPDSQLWPKGTMARATARAISAEMHSGFHALRSEFPMDVRRKIQGIVPSDKARLDIERIVTIWREMKTAEGRNGDFLFGAFTIADAMFAPVATRFQTYNIDLADFGDDGTAASYAKKVLALPEMQEWAEAAG